MAAHDSRPSATIPCGFSGFSRKAATALIAAALAAMALTAAATLPTFTDVTKAAGIRFRHDSGAFGKKYLPETMGSGAAFFDGDGDGAQDILFVNSMSWPGRPAEPLTARALQEQSRRHVHRRHGRLGPRGCALRPWRRGRRLRQRRQDRSLHHRARKEPPVPQPWRPALRRRHRRGRCRQHRVLDQRRVARLRPRRAARSVRRQLRRLVGRERPVLHARRQVEVGTARPSCTKVRARRSIAAPAMGGSRT